MVHYLYAFGQVMLRGAISSPLTAHLYALSTFIGTNIQSSRYKLTQCL